MLANSVADVATTGRVREGALDAVCFKDVRFRWRGATHFELAVAQFQLRRGERLLLLGPSGSGKSTFLSLLAGIVSPDAGEINVLGEDIAKLRGASRDRFRAEHFGIIFQMFNLLPYASLLDNVVLPLRFAKGRRQRAIAAGGVESEARRLLEALGIQPSLIDKASASSLSVGQQQRVAAARALIGGPQILVADEPTSALDRAAEQAFLGLLFSQAASVDASVIMVSHDEGLAPHFDRVLRLDEIAVARRGELT